LHYFYVKLDLYLHTDLLTTREKEEEETRERKKY